MDSKVEQLHSRAESLVAKFEQGGGTNNIDKAIVLDRKALKLCLPGHRKRSACLTQLSSHLNDRYKQLWVMMDLEEAIGLDREALELCPPGHRERSMSLHNLAADLSTRYKQLGAAEDLDEAIGLGRDSMALYPRGHPDRSTSLENLAGYLYTRYAQSRQSNDIAELFSLYAKLADRSQVASSTDLYAARAWIHVAEKFQHHTTLLAYQTSLRLLIRHLITLPSLPRHLPLFKNLGSSLAVNAFSVCLRDHSPTNAVELLEQGRSVFWSQLSHLRSPLHDVITSVPRGKTLADQFMQLTSHIRDALDSPGANRRDRVCGLNFELENVVARIRRLPGLSRFLLPSLFSDLKQAAREGPVIIVNASKYGCDAVVVLRDRDPVRIPLSITKDQVRELTVKFHTLTVRAMSMDVTRDLVIFLRGLWDDVVSHIVDLLRSARRPLQSRIWWCPTAEFTLLPLHAAGPYRQGKQNLDDLYISSYTPTLSALIHARRQNTSNSAAEGKRFVGIGQAQTTDESELLSVSIELANVSQSIGSLAIFTCIDGPEACIARVCEELRKSEWVHLACHGLLDRTRPFDSAFALHDGRLTIQRIIQCELENPQFAYLSACHTTAGDGGSPNEVIHLASAMQFAGFRSVVGTMWAVDDEATTTISPTFYENVKDGTGRLDHTRAAFALNKTMREVVNIPFDQRILFIHLGA